MLTSLPLGLDSPVCRVQGYGGYLALMMLKSTDSLVKCAAAMSPVTDWRLYGESAAFRPEHQLPL